MKKIIAFVFIFALCFMSIPVHYANASEGVSQEMIDKAIEKNYGIDNIIILQHKSDGYYWLFVELDANKEYGAPYDLSSYSSPWRVSSRDAYNPIFVSPSNWYMTYFWWDDSSNTWVDNRWSVHDFNVPAFDVVYASQNVMYDSGYYDEALRNTPFFMVAPRPTKLAGIVEQSTRLQNPMTQVVLLIPLLISLVVSFLGFRKCLQMLRTLLSRS